MYTFMIDKGDKASGAIFYDLDHARELIMARDPAESARLAGVEFDAARSEFRLKSLAQDITVSYPECRARFTGTSDAPRLAWHLCVLHHLAAADGATLSGKWVSIRDAGMHMAHPHQFESHTDSAIAKNLSCQPLGQIKAAAEALGADFQTGIADLNAVFHLLPRFPVLVQVWLDDDEMPGAGKALFDSRCLHYLADEDIYYSGLMLVNFFVEQYKAMFG